MDFKLAMCGTNIQRTFYTSVFSCLIIYGLYVCIYFTRNIDREVDDYTLGMEQTYDNAIVWRQQLKNRTTIEEWSTPQRHLHCFQLIWNINEFQSYINKNIISKNNTFSPTPCRQFVTLDSPDGRTGNQLFQIAALLGTAFNYDLIPVISPSFPLLKYFELPNIMNIKLEKLSKCSQYFPGIYHNCLNISSNKHSNGNLSMQGFLQSWKYFKNVEGIIRGVFTIRSRYIKGATEFLEKNIKVGYKKICIHVRRGDMVGSAQTERGNAVVDAKFISKAIQFCNDTFRDAIFFVLSDDIRWCKTNIKENVIFSPFTDAGYDMALMTSCDHVVITSGSFGWWGAWLSGGTAVYFNGFPRHGSPQDKRFNRYDYYPPEWIAL